MSKQVPIITIDGPSGAGKGTVCRLVAQRLGYSLLDSGALYRLTALASVNAGIDLHEERQVEAVARCLDVQFEAVGSGVRVILSGRNVSDEIRHESVGMNASVVAAYPSVRLALLERQRAFAKLPGLVADGRDMGTEVFPEASSKIFLTASAEERAVRRMAQLERAGIKADIDTILADIRDRDLRDTSRSSSPLKPASDALVVDSTDLTIDQVVQVVLMQVEQK